MIYTMNGMSTQISLQADRPGVYPGLSSHFSGDGFPGMHFNLTATTPQQFAAWVAAARAGGRPLDLGSYAALAQQSANVAPFTFGSVSPGLYQAVATQTIAQAPGPQVDGSKGRPSPKPER